MAILLLLAALPSGAQETADQAPAQPPGDDVTELIVLLAPGSVAPRPEAVVEAVNAGGAVPGGLGAGNPRRGELGITHRATGRTRQWLEENPDTPEARLQRYVVLEYGDEVNLDAIMEALSHNPNVLSVEKNLKFYIAAAPSPAATLPSDPFLPEGTTPLDHQWGSHVMNLPEAWDYVKGHAYLGFLDYGLQVDHPDLRPFHEEDGRLVYDYGNFREHFSEDFHYGDCSVDEREQNQGRVGHGSHVAGLAAATTHNETGVAGSCWRCSIMMQQIFPPTSDAAYFSDAARALRRVVEYGVQAVSMSFGNYGSDTEPVSCPNQELLFKFFCDALALADEREVVLLGSAGNDLREIWFPARDPRVMSIGGIKYHSQDGYTFWDDSSDPGCPPDYDEKKQCGSNFGEEQDLVAPARTVLSTLYTGEDWNLKIGCGDSQLPPSDDGVGPCTGTSMAAPFVGGTAGMVRSVNPLLTKDEVRDVLISTSSHADAKDPKMGYGVPDSAAAVKRARGTVGGKVLPNRLTPLVVLYSQLGQTHLATTNPQMASAAIHHDRVPFDSAGQLAVPGYPQFPGVRCPSPCVWEPRASVYIFTSDTPPFPGAPPLIPLYRLSYNPNYDPASPERCFDPDPDDEILNRDFTYAAGEEEMLKFRNEIADPQGIGYLLDGIEGYVYAPCEPEPQCIPEGAVKLLRYYNYARDDYAIFPENEKDSPEYEGYEGGLPGLRDVIAYVYPNKDSDSDNVIDAFERLIGTDPYLADSDCDGLSDGEEVLVYDMSDPNPANHGYGDPQDGRCATIFADGFETGDTARWSGTVLE